MDIIKLDNIEEINKVVGEFHTFPSQLRLVTAKRIHSRLAELGGFVKVLSNNPILKYPSEHFIIVNVQGANPYDKYTSMIRQDENEFNLLVYNDIDLRLDNLSDLVKMNTICNELNNYADELYIREFPEAKDFIDIVKMAASKIERYMRHGGSQDIVRTSLDDIEFILGSNKLSDYHIRRELLASLAMKNKSLYRNELDNNIEKRLVNLFNTQISIPRHTNSNNMLFKDFNKSSLEAYLKVQKRTYEETLVYSNIDSDYDRSNFNLQIDKDKLVKLNDRYMSNKYITNIDQIDLFKLINNGFDTTGSFTHNNVTLCGYVKEGSEFLILKSVKHENIYYLIGESSKYRVKLNEKGSVCREDIQAVCESAFLPPYNKMNRR